MKSNNKGIQKSLEMITVGEVERWLDKLSKVKSRGARIVMVKLLLKQELEKQLDSIKLEKKKCKYDEDYNCTETKWDCNNNQGYNQAVDDLEKLKKGER